MSFEEVTSDNFSIYINQFKDDFKRYEKIFENLERRIVEFECKCKRDKYDIKDRFSSLDESLSIEILSLCRINSFLFDKEIIHHELSFDVSSFSNVIKKSGEIFSEMNKENEIIKLIELKMPKDQMINDCEPKATEMRSYLVASRQTNKPFILALMQRGSRQLCNGCRQNIPFQVNYLKHFEEYPAGSNQLLPHSYHIDRKCICARGFQKSYLCNSKVICEEDINDNISEALVDIGFTVMNIQTKDDSDCESEQSDNLSQYSGASHEPSQNIRFFLKRRSLNQKKRLECFGCQELIVSDSYLTYGNSVDKVFHMQKKCLQCVISDFNRAKCMVFKLLTCYSNLTELLSCGFYYKNIIGSKPPNPNKKHRAQSSSLHRVRPQNPVKPPMKDVSFLSNNEAFHCERLLHGQRCQGCNQNLERNDLSLRHKERVPREKLLETPLISQYYHCANYCLIGRGFTRKYIDESTCTVVLSGQDNAKSVRDILTRCGFYDDKLIFGTTSSNNSLNNNVTSTANIPLTPPKGQKFIVELSNGNTGVCETCKFELNIYEFFLKVVCSTDDSSLPPVLLHMIPNCVSRQGYSLEDLAESELVVSVPMTPSARQKLQKCGFHNLS